MNLMILCDKNMQKFLVRNIDFTENNFAVLSYENELRNDFSNKVRQLLPNIIVVFHGYRSREANLIVEVLKIRQFISDIRVVYCFGKVSDENDFMRTSSKLLENDICDISITDYHSQVFQKEFFDLLRTPMSPDGFKELLQKRADSNKYKFSESVQSELVRVVDNTKVNFSKKEMREPYSCDETVQLDLLQEWKNTDHFVVCVSSVNKNSGEDDVIQTAFELSSALIQAKQGISLFLPDGIYASFLRFHEIDLTLVNNGCTVNRLPIYPLSIYTEKFTFMKYTILAVPDITDPLFARSDIKIVMCKSGEWKIKQLEDYINLPLPFSKEINYCFYPVSQKDFRKINKAMVQGHCKAFRLRTSPNYTNPCQWNRDVYDIILNLYSDVNTKKKMKLFGR